MKLARTIAATWGLQEVIKSVCDNIIYINIRDNKVLFVTH